MFLKFLSTIVILFGLIGPNIFGQSVGFGCLGLSGIYGGYSIQRYDATGLNQFLTDSGYYTQSGTLDNLFSEGDGFRVGANIFRAKFSGSFLTVKGYYQFIREKETLKNLYNLEDAIHKFELKMDHWGVGIDFGIPLFSILDWKIIDGGVNFYKSKLTHETVNEFGTEEEIKYELPSTTIGYYAGTGIVLEVIPGYLSIEGSAIYKHIQIEQLKRKSDGILIPENADQNIIDNGGFSGVVQLNLGVPL